MAQENTLEVQGNLEYFAMSKPKRLLYKFCRFFTTMPKKISRSFSKTKSVTKRATHSFLGIFKTIGDAAVRGDWKTRLSFLVMGLGLMTRHQIIRGVFYLLYEVAFIAFMVFIGGPTLANFGSLGSLARVEFTGISGILELPVYSYNHDSFTILLYSLIGIILIFALVFLWYNQLADSLRLQRAKEIGRETSDRQTLKNIFDKSYDKTLLAVPIGGLLLFTILPMVMMIIIAFTNYDYAHQTPTALFDWVGAYNFSTLFAGDTANAELLSVFGKVLLWTLVWAFFATFSNYFLGMIVAMIINIKGIKLKKLWRTILITTIAVPQFISLLLVSQMFADGGVINQMLIKAGLIESGIKWLTDPIIAKVMIIVINTWVGIPYTMLISTGLLMNIPEDLYESARIDGASPFKMYFKITLPYMLFVTGPYLISQFVGNINNFNVIYLLSNGGPAFILSANVPVQFRISNIGQTDLLITWIYKMTTNSNFDYGAASVLSLLVFLLIAFFTLLFYNRSGSVNDEEAFQ